MGAWIRTSLIAFMIFVLASPALAANRLALVIGNDIYSNLHPDLNLKKARNDARAVAETLETLGFKVTLALDVDRFGMNQVLDTFSKQIEPGDTAALFFAGHGVRIQGRNYLLPSDVPDMSTIGSQNLLAGESIAVDVIVDLLKQRGARLAMLILDACRNNPFKMSNGRSVGGSRGLARMEPPEGTMILFSAGAGQAALDRLNDVEEEPNSVFTRLLIPMLKKEGLEVGRMARLVRQEVKQLAATIGHVQIPAVYNEMTGDFYLTAPGPQQSAPVTSDAPPGEPDLVFWSSIKDSNKPAAFEAYLKQFPNGIFSALARIRLEELKPKVAILTPNEPSDASPAKPVDRNQVPPITECDRLTAQRYDKSKSHAVISACEQAVDIFPGTPRLEYRLGRAYNSDARYTKAAEWFRKSADQGYADAQYSLAIRYDNGQGVAQDHTEAVRWYRKAADQGHLSAQFNLGVSYASGEGVARDYAEAARWYRKAADRGHTKAQYNLAIRYDNGQGVAQDHSEAVRWYRKAADQGHVSAQFNLGVSYASGEGVTRDYAEAAKWYRRAADQGHAKAQYNLALRYDNGQGVEQDHSEAVRWYRKAADQGHASAQLNLGVSYARGEGVARDYAQAAKWYRKAADQGHAKAQYNLALRYDNGQGVAQDYAEAVRWYRKAADQGHAKAQYNLGHSYARGEGVARDYAEAVRWYRKAADQGHAKAQFSLALRYDNGKGITRDHSQAVRWYRKAADQGHASAQHNLGVSYVRGEGVAQDYAEAIKWFRKAADQGDEDAQYSLGLRYHNGQGVRRDYAEAAKWYEKASDSGNMDARHSLGYLYDRGLGGLRKDPKRGAELIASAIKASNDYSMTELKSNSRAYSKSLRMELQRIMRRAGAYSGAIDGSIGSGTKAAIDRYAAQD